jgi:16S rRNA (guanine527-N7)-methyltransferase
MTPEGAPDDASALFGIVTVSRETEARLAAYVALLRKWQAADNLVSSNTLGSIWRRHVADSAQLVGLFPDAKVWLDLGSGAGFPGLVVAILLNEGGAVHLVESNRRKCAFLRQVIRETGAKATVHEDRVDRVVADWRQPVDMISARALAPLTALFGMVQPLIAAGGRAAFHKGQDFAREIDEASKSWEFDLLKHVSRVDEKGVILEIQRLMPKSADQG